MSDCNHEMIDLDYLPQTKEGSNVVLLSLKVSCRHCGPLRFVGIDAGLSLSQPSTSTDGCVVHIPVVPELDDAVITWKYAS